MTACAAKPAPQIEYRLVYPALPQSTCAGEPAPPPAGADDRAIVRYFEARRLAGAECRARLKAVHDTQARWPINKDQN